MKEPTWVDMADCFYLHDAILIMHGGLPGVRDQGLLESTLHRPVQRFNYGKPTRFEMAAVYATVTIKNHPFLDGNKRTGFLAAALFLEVNGLIFSATEENVVMQTLALAAGEIDESTYAAWLKKSCRRPRSG